MRTAKKVLATLAVAGAVGCAGSGGGEDFEVSYAYQEPAPNQARQVCTCIGLQCLIVGCLPRPEGYTSSGGAGALPESHAYFTSWAALQRERDTEAEALLSGYTWQRAPADGIQNAPTRADLIVFRYGVQDDLRSIASWSDGDARASFAAPGGAGIDVLYTPAPTGALQSFYTSLPAKNVALVANPYAQGWQYQSFGVWAAQDAAGGGVNAVAFGRPAPASTVPTSGSATFTGKLAAFYLSPAGEGAAAAANLSVSVNFQARSLGLSSTDMVLTRDFAAGTAAPQLNVSGAMTYVAGANAFSGTLTTAGGSLSGATNGRFYGSGAPELGGVFVLRSATGVESFAGAYGARR